jgi:phosphomevalonate kinase
MKSVQASAPGKAVLSGEYVVLDGAPAIAVALNRRVQVAVSEAPSGHHELTAPGLADGSWRFEAGNGGKVDWLDASAKGLFSLFESVWYRVKPVTDQRFAIRIDSGEFFDARSGGKLGLGSSAAVAAALSGALGRYTSESQDVMATAVAAHRDFQCGRGSGIDVAASCSGGVLNYSLNSAHAPAALNWPDGLSCRFFWSGRSASTVERIEKYCSAGNSSTAEASKAKLVAAAESVSAKWLAGSAHQLVTSFADYNDALLAFSDDYDLGIFAGGHHEMTAMASDCGIVYKPCVAGGGDIGVALSTDEPSIRKFCERAERHGSRPLDVQVEQQGLVVQVESET